MSLPRIAILSLLMALPLLGCGGDKGKDDKKEEPSIPVEVGTARIGVIDAAYRGTATLEAEDEAIGQRQDWRRDRTDHGRGRRHGEGRPGTGAA